MNSTSPRKVAVVGGNRIPFARSNSAYATASNQDMLTAALDGLVARYGLEGERLGEVAAGAVLKHSRDFNLTRECVLGSRLAADTPAYDVGQACGTGLQAVVGVANKIALGQIDAGIGGGVDTTSDAPIAVNEDLRAVLLELNRTKSTAGRLKLLAKLRPGQIVPQIPQNAEPRTGLSMGEHQARTAKHWGITREAQDELAAASHRHLAAAYDRGFTDDLVSPYLGLSRDENLRPDSTPEKLAKLKPAFGGPEGTMTAGNSTPLSDGASAVLLATDEWAEAHGLPVLAHITHAETAAVDYVGGDEGLLMAPAYAMPRMLARAGLGFEDFDLYEIHEAFAAQVLTTLAAWEDPVFCRERLGLDAPLGHVDRARLNVNGGSLAAGHPFAATGGRIVAGLAKALDERGPGHKGVISICAAGGQGVVAILEKLMKGTTMTDRYSQLVNSLPGRFVAKNVGLPVPTPLERHTPGDAVLDGVALLGGASGGRLTGPIATVLADAGVAASTELRDDLRTAAADAGLDAAVFNPDAPGEQRFKALVFDATGIERSDDLGALHAFFSPGIRRLGDNGRMLVLGTPPEACDTPRAATAQHALEGFTRSLAKEARGASTAQLVYVAPGGEGHIASTLRFLLSRRSAYVDAQVVRIGKATKPPKVDWERPLEGRTALVTGASRGIGAAIAATLARDGAHVIGLDIPALGADLRAVCTELGGTPLELDITAADAPAAIVAALTGHGGADVVVHNAGITRDKSIAAMKPEGWAQVLDVNLSAEERIDEALLDAGEAALKKGARIVCVSSISGIAGNTGQTNYATSKAGVIGMVQALAPTLKRGITINAVAPGFIETQMTAKVPIALREAGRRMNSLSQGGLPVDVAETIAWFASPASGGVNGNVVRVCGQSLLGGVMGTATLYARALVPAIPGASKLPFVGGSGGEVPELELRQDFAVDAEHLARYSKLCGFRLSGTLPPTYPNVLAFPLHMQVITDRRFPFPALGLVHVANRIEQHRPITIGAPLELCVTPTPLRPHPKGRTFSIRTRATVDGEVVWEGESTMLRRGQGDESAKTPRDDREAPPASATWKLGSDLGRRYAGVSGDINPIHLYDVTAKLFGFKRAIVHGLWTKARALAALEGRLPSAYAVDVQFRKPVLLPATVSFGSAAEADGSIRFTVQDAKKDTPHLAGNVTPNERSAA